MRISDWSSDVCSSDLLTAHLLPRFFSIGEIEHALDNGAVTLHTPIKARYHTVDEDMNPVTRVVRTTPGRMLLAEILPRHPKVPFDLINRLLTKREISHVIRSEEHTSELQSLMRTSYA